MSDFIIEIENALTGDECKSLISRFEESPDKKPGMTGAGLNLDLKRSTDLTLPLDKTVLASIRPALKVYHLKFPSLPKKLQSTTYTLMRYMTGEFYHWHFDNQTATKRQYVAIWYLNDVEDGGHTEFLYYPRVISPREGKLVLFPAGWTHTHRGSTPLSGPKYIATTWLSLE